MFEINKITQQIKFVRERKKSCASLIQVYFVSAVLAAGAPEHAAFMADESMLALPGLKPLAYTLGFYNQYMDQVKGIVKQLNKGISI